MTTIKDVHKAYEKTLHIENHHLIDVPLATYITKHLDGDRLFLIGKGASGGGKSVFTEPLRRLSFDPLSPVTADDDTMQYRIFFISRLTPATFAQGNTKGGSNDLGYYLENHSSMLIYSDMAPLLTMGEETRTELFGMFRDLFDGIVKLNTGRFSKFYRNIKVNSIGFSTHLIETQTDMNALMGTREIVYELPEIKDIEKAMNKRDTPEGREIRANTIKDFLDDIGKVGEKQQGVWDFSGDFKEPDKERKEFIKNFARKASIDRTPSQTNDYGLLVRHIKTEYPMRLNNQLITLYKGLTGLGLNEAEALHHVIVIAQSCGNSLRREILNKLESADGYENRYEEKNSYQLGYELNIAPREILKHLMVLRDMYKVVPIITKEEKVEFKNNIFTEGRKWTNNLREVSKKV